MNHFQNWYISYISRLNAKTEDLKHEVLFRIGWKAALKWIYAEAKKLEKQPESPMDAFDLIEEELEE